MERRGFLKMFGLGAASAGGAALSLIEKRDDADEINAKAKEFGDDVIAISGQLIEGGSYPRASVESESMKMRHVSIDEGQTTSISTVNELLNVVYKPALVRYLNENAPIAGRGSLGLDGSREHHMACRFTPDGVETEEYHDYRVVERDPTRYIVYIQHLGVSNDQDA